MKRWVALAFACVFLTAAVWSPAQEEAKSRMTPERFSGLKLRGIGPAIMSGRISDISIDPNDRSIWYVGVGSGNVWKTVNCGTTWTPIFDNYGAYSIGCVTIDPNNSLIIWVGTGENTSQRAVGWGNGVYKSLDGGKSWTNMGLPRSEHVAEILIDPRDSDVVWVASQGPLWAPGGDRGLFKSTDGGKTWNLVLEIDENTGVSSIEFDPRNPDVVYATSYQRRRHVWAVVAGGPGSAIFKTTDGGETWKKIVRGLPNSNLGNIGIAVSPQKPDVLYATVPASWGESGFYRSEDGGENWVRMNDYITTDPQYYQELYPDPHQFDRVYCIDVFVHITDDGGKTFQEESWEWKHCDNHEFVFDPNDPNYIMVGCDGGIYETWDRGDTWKFVYNLPVTQFYRVGVDNALPFYNVYGGTQDNDTECGPSRTTTQHGIRNDDWFITATGDGYQTRVDPENTNIIYSMSQDGYLIRFDRASGEYVDLQPQPGKGEPGLKWNWDSPLIISPHSNTRLYFASNRLFRSDDRGDTWTAISPDLNRGIDRNKLEVMGTVWSSEVVWKNHFTSYYGNSVSLSESPLVEGLIYVGTDDGLIQVTEDGGANWRKIESFPGVPKLAYVTDLCASLHDADTVYACFNDYKAGNFTPYVYKSTDRGRTWTSIVSNLPDGQTSWCIVEDHVKPGLLFYGGEFGLYFTVNDGKSWIQLKGNLPVIPFRDLEIQRRESDLVCATFGRGFYIFDDYSPLRHVSEEVLTQEATLFPVKKALMYLPSMPLGASGKSVRGDNYFTAPNPPFGAIFTYHLGESLTTLRQQRKAAEMKLQREGKPVYYPDWDYLRKEDRQQPPKVILTVSDMEGNVVQRVEGPTSAGFHRVAWDLCHPSTLMPTDGWYRPLSGPMAMPGTYQVSISKIVDGVVTPLGETHTFEVEPLNLATLPAPDRASVVAFQRKVASLIRVTTAANTAIGDSLRKLDTYNKTLLSTPAADTDLLKTTHDLRERLLDLQIAMNGDRTISKRFERIPPSINRRLWRIMSVFWSCSSAPTTTHQENYRIAAEEFEEVLPKLRQIVEVELVDLESKLEAAGAPYTPGRKLPDWKYER